ncbi:MAG TPA: 16S rRNA (guanine(527)-N(7))-methyltransferase RsmG [Candidatus Merdibacter merdavium]|uniref:Ribosomal RNA small subunit methyltransferase G n=1 Tax=Candidatus Merdibacter merdavium TaxID=2838692 RepID=A0A9D2SVJ9_9FIRM|nr:16S rRNA (guanine(527)-N(7))-methyltransferase RsmG [Candidatus Merdibacter merdavium]
MRTFTKETFVQILRDHGQQPDAAQMAQFDRYVKELTEWNQKMNLTAITAEAEVYEKHFLDSLLPFLNLKLTHLCDVGAGAGFPSIPLKIMRPDLEVTILEPLNKRILFLNHLCAQLGLKNVRCIHTRAEDHAKEHRESYPAVSARAVASLPVLCELCLPLVEEGGLFIAMKGPGGMEEAAASAHAFSVLGAELERSEKSVLSDGAERINLFCRKVRPAPKKYPRNFGQIKKHPL